MDQPRILQKGLEKLSANETPVKVEYEELKPYVKIVTSSRSSRIYDKVE